MPGFERGKILIRVAELMERDIDQLASLEALDNGKTFKVAKGVDVSRVLLSFILPASNRVTGGGAHGLRCRSPSLRRCLGTMEVGPTRSRAKRSKLQRPNSAYTVHEPNGVCGQISECDCVAI